MFLFYIGSWKWTLQEIMGSGCQGMFYSEMVLFHVDMQFELHRIFWFVFARLVTPLLNGNGFWNRYLDPLEFYNKLHCMQFTNVSFILFHSKKNDEYNRIEW